MKHILGLPNWTVSIPWKRSYGNYHADPIDECDDIENVWIFVTNIVNLEVNFGNVTVKMKFRPVSGGDKGTILL